VSAIVEFWGYLLLTFYDDSYVDAQLRQSKRFDADGIRREYPHLFVPVASRRTSLSDTETESNGHKSGDTGSGSTSRLNSMSHTREESQLRYWTSDMCSRSPHLFDFVVTLGGDGTVLFCSWLFQRIVPPVLPFALGSLGFLTNFDYSDYKKVLKSALDTGIRVNLRMRFTATVYRATLPVSSVDDRRKRRAIRSGKTGEIIMRTIQEGGWNRLESAFPPHQDLRGIFTESGGDAKNASKDRAAPDSGTTPAGKEGLDGRGSAKGDKRDKEVMCFSTRPVETFEVLNDLVVDRGPSPYVSQLEVFGDEHHMTTAQADGLCISTPTGSTAYSLSAGGSLVHPEIPAILITPICPHTLSFRPMLLPDSMELRIAVPYNSRSTAWASFDGRGRVELKQGDHIKVTASRYPFPTVCAENQSIDWFQSISRTLKWNERQRQKSFVVLEEGAQEEEQRNELDKNKASKKKVEEETAANKAANKKDPAKAGACVNADDDDDDADADEQEEEEEAFDIDDTSTAATRASSPDLNKERHHHTHHHRRQSNHGRSSRSGSSTPASSTSNLIMNNLAPLTMTKTSSSDASNSKKNGVKFDESSTSLNTYIGAQPTSGIAFQSGANGGKEQKSKGDEESVTLSDYNQHGVAQPSTRSLLDSPDRFGVAGPPMPPRALSERHLASADFRLDGGKVQDPSEEELDTKQSGSITTEEKKKSRSRSNSKRDSVGSASKRETIGPAASGNISVEDNPLEQTRAPLLEPGGPSKAASRLYKKLRGKTKSNRNSTGDANAFDGLELSRNNSRGTGAALVVYGQDESDSDSTAEG
jgi:NAD+ kinase